MAEGGLEPKAFDGCFSNHAVDLNVVAAEMSHFEKVFAYCLLTIAVVLLALGAALAANRARRGDWPRMTLHRQGKTQSEMDVKVKELVQERHREFWRIIFQMGGPFSWFLILVFMLRIMSKVGSPHMEMEAVAEASNIDFFSFVFCLLFSTIFQLWPCSLTTRSLHGFLVLCHLGTSRPLLMTYMSLRSGKAATASLIGVQYVFSGNLALSRLVLNMHCESIPFTVLTNFGNSVVLGYLRAGISREIGCDHDQAMVQDEFIMFVFITALCISIRQVNIMQIRATLAAKGSDNIVNAIETILYGMCDAVVHLDENLSLKKPSQELDAMLLYTPAPSGRMPLNFYNILSGDSDRQKFSDFIRPVTQTEGKLPASLHVSIRDTMSSQVQVQLFHTRCLDSFDRVFHIVGIRESTDGAYHDTYHHSHNSIRGTPHVDTQDMSAQDNQDKVTALAPSNTMSRISEDGTSEQGSSDWGCVDVLHLVDISEYQPGEISVWIDPNMPGLPMRKCTPEFFTRLGGPSLKAGLPLLARAPGKDRKWLLDQVQGTINQLASSGIRESAAFQLRLRQPGWATHVVQMNVSLSIDVADFAEDEPLPLVRMTCWDVCCRPRQSLAPDSSLSL